MSYDPTKPFTITLSKPVEPQDAEWLNDLLAMSAEKAGKRYAESEYVWDFIRDEMVLRRQGK